MLFPVKDRNELECVQGKGTSRYASCVCTEGWGVEGGLERKLSCPQDGGRGSPVMCRAAL